MSKKYLSWIFIVSIITVGVFFIVGDLIKKTADEPLVTNELKINEVNKDGGGAENTLEPAIETRDSSLKKFPSPPALGRPLNLIASISGLEKDEVIEQIKHFEASLINKPENFHEWIQLGNLRKIIGDYLGAVEYWKYASLLQPTYHVSYNNLGNLYQYYLNDMVKAEENLKKYIELSPKTEEPYKLLFDLYALSYTEKENLAIGVLEDGIKNATYNDYLKRLLENYKKEKGIE